MVKGKIPFYSDADQALQAIDKLLKDNSDGREWLRHMINLMVLPDRRFTFYLGAGCSMQVKAKFPLGGKPYQPRSWVDLLRAIFFELPQEKRKKFLADFPLDSFEDVLKSFDRLQVAWFLSSCFHTPELRDETIRDLVEPVTKERTSPLYDSLLKLPFADIVTTNYDSNTSHFAEHIYPGEEFIEITSSSDMKKHFDGRESRRFFYLHGKVGRRLVFDRFEYAHLLNERDGIIDYVTFLLRGSHVLFVGFSLDDLSFNLMDTHLHLLSPEKRPISFAFLAKVTTAERQMWHRRGLYIIEYGDHEILTALFQHANTIRKFMQWAEPSRMVSQVTLPNLNEDRTQGYMQMGLEAYVRGDFGESIIHTRAALASTLFWERSGEEEGRLFLDSSRVATFVDIRIRMALSHYRLRWSGEDKQDPKAPDHDHIKASDINMESAENVLNAQEKKGINPSSRIAFKALRSSLNSLKGRIRYHEGKLLDVLKLCEEITTEKLDFAQLNSPERPKKEEIIWTLKLAEVYYYARCQKARVIYQLRGYDPSGRTDWTAVKKETIHELKELEGDVDQLCGYLASFEDTCKGLAEWRYYSSSVATILQITRWMTGRYSTAISRDVIPVKDERNMQAYDALTFAIEKLEDETSCKKGEKPPIRWNAMRYRYLCRAYALRWLVSQTGNQFTGLSERKNSRGDLLAAHNAIGRALDETRGPGLERQQVVNLFESSRISLLELFGERILGTAPSDSVSPSAARCLGFLDASFRRISGLLAHAEGKELDVLGFRIATYFAMVAGPVVKDLLPFVHNQQLKAFLGISDAERVAVVGEKYQEFAKNFGDAKALDQRISDFVSTFKLLAAELIDLNI